MARVIVIATRKYSIPLGGVLSNSGGSVPRIFWFFKGKGEKGFTQGATNHYHNKVINVLFLALQAGRHAN